jgi:hypothetical protein
MTLKVFIGWEAKQHEAYLVARQSLLRRSSIPVTVSPLSLTELRASGLYWRGDDALASTEFTLTRFLVPYLAGDDACALYFDCDFLWLDDCALLLAGIAAGRAVHCVKHDHQPAETMKMEGKAQSAYPRKNWSSLMLFAPQHPACRRLTPELVNGATPAHLHRMAWAPDEAIGGLDARWNWLEGSSPAAAQPPGAVHFTRGGPWLEGWRDVAYADAWRAERDRIG